MNCLDEPVFMTVSKPLLTELGIHHRLESCVTYLRQYLYIISIMSTYSGSLFPWSLTFYNKTITFLGQYLYIKSKMSLRSRSEQPQARSAVGCEWMEKSCIFLKKCRGSIVLQKVRVPYCSSLVRSDYWY